ncbi:MAG: choice-of-anchor B family protein [Planctomycetes bacterium]|nr:choice-of-anchor B family protein [Planctomycetota bacterium]
MVQFRSLTSAVPVLVVIAASLHLAPNAVRAQGTNVRLLAHVDRFPGGTASSNNYAGIWGTVVNGREIAIVPARTGTLFYDCTNPSSPVEVAFIPGPTGGAGYFWREVQSCGIYVYIASEHGAFQVVSLANPASPQLLGTFGNTAHTVSIDCNRRILWASGGAGRGVVLYDLAANPISPPQIGVRSNPYVHDCLPNGRYCYLAQMFDGSFGIVDATNPANLVTVSRTPTPSAFPHNVAVDADETWAIVTEEQRGDCFTVYDITNKAAPIQLVRWCSPTGATVHNVFVTGSIAHLACYADGLFTIDMSNPSAPAMIGQYDTSAFSGNNYVGDWGCYPFQPSGVVYLSDMQSGFWIVEPTCGVPWHYGNATAGTGGVAPRIDFDGGVAKVGNAGHQLVAEHTVGGAQTAFLLAFAAGNTPFSGIDVLVDLSVPPIAISVTANGTAGVAGAGRAVLPLGVPNSAALAGFTLFVQAVTFDAGGPQGLAATRGMRFTVCP